MQIFVDFTFHMLCITKTPYTIKKPTYTIWKQYYEILKVSVKKTDSAVFLCQHETPTEHEQIILKLI